MEGTVSSGRKLVGHANFVRNNTMSDRFKVHGFHHVEFWVQDATNVSQRFSWGLGLRLVAKSDLSTGNHSYASYVLQSNDLTFVFTAPYSAAVSSNEKIPNGHAVNGDVKVPLPYFSHEEAFRFQRVHGMAARAVGIRVEDAAAAYEAATANGGIGMEKPRTLVDKDNGVSVTIAEVKLYGDVALRFLSSPSGDAAFTGPFLPGYVPVNSPPLSYGITRIDHIVGNVPKLIEAVDYICNMTGFHEFAEFISEDVGTVDSGLNSMVLACNNEMVLLPVNEPTFGTPRKSQIQTYLEHNEGPGVQHLALMCVDIFETVGEMRKRTHCGGFDFMPQPSNHYYKKALREKFGSELTEEQYTRLQELGILADKDDQGTLFQIFTKPLGDRPTVFIEIIQRVGCMVKDAATGKEYQTGGCGGFGKGNFSELFKSIEDFERTLDIS